MKIVFTATDLKKGIVDVPRELQEALAAAGIHDFDAQPPGARPYPAIPCLVDDGDPNPCMLGANRPATKDGAFRRFSRIAALVRRLGIQPGDAVLFNVHQSRDGIPALKASSHAPASRTADRDNAESNRNLSLQRRGQGTPNKCDNPSEESTPMPREANLGEQDASLHGGGEYPNRLSQWALDGESSVKRPFEATGENPLNELILTPLVTRLRSLAQEMINGESDCRILILGGGAGNGKSAALEDFLRSLTAQAPNPFEANSYLQEQFSCPNRSIEIDLNRIGIDIPGIHQVTVVQDASEGTGKSVDVGQLLVDDIEAALNQPNNLLIACANRGILQSAIRTSNTQASRGISFLNDVVRSLDPASKLPCWPIPKTQGAYVWPMDIESLVDDRIGTDGQNAPSVARQIIEMALHSWEPTSNEPHDPIEQNRRLLLNEDFLRFLEKNFQHYQAIVGARLTFRMLFGILGHLLGGGDVRAHNDARTVSDFARSISADCEAGSPSKKIQGRMDRLRALAHHALFPLLPSGSFINDHEGESKEVLRDLVSYLESSQESKSKSQVPTFLRSSNFVDLDPARQGMIELESKFNSSIQAGIDYVHDHATTIEIEALQVLAGFESELQKINCSDDRDAMEIRQAVWFLRRLACMIAKRSCWTAEPETGLRCDVDDFRTTIRDQGLADKVAGLIREVAGSDEDETVFIVNLDYVIGQPVRTTDAVATVDRPEVKLQVAQPKPDRPFSDTCIIELRPPDLEDSDPIATIPYDFAFHRRLKDRHRKVVTACLSPMARGTLDRARIVVDGLAMRGWGSDEGSNVTLKLALPQGNTKIDATLVEPGRWAFRRDSSGQ